MARLKATVTFQLTQKQVESRDAWVYNTICGYTLDGVHYWGRIRGGAHLKLSEIDGPGKALITVKNACVAWERMAALHGLDWYSNPRNDASTYDLAIQLLMFGEVRYA